jgi:hypothetical protein
MSEKEPTLRVYRRGDVGQDFRNIGSLPVVCMNKVALGR